MGGVYLPAPALPYTTGAPIETVATVRGTVDVNMASIVRALGRGMLKMRGGGLLRKVGAIAVTTVMGYVAFLLIVGGYAVLFSRESGFMVEGVAGGGILAFGILLPAFVALAVVDALRSPHEQPQATNEHVPAQPQPQAEQEPPPWRERGEGVEQPLDPHAVPPPGHHVPRHEGHQQHGPPDGADHRRIPPEHAPMVQPPPPIASHRSRRSAGTGPQPSAPPLIGWMGLVMLAAAWEAVALIDPADAFHSLSWVVNLIERVPVLQWLAFALWVVVGYRLLQPD